MQDVLVQPRNARRSRASPSREKPVPEHDWSSIPDPQAKKRVQNRVAQRTYRRRMKARLEELQAKVKSHEQQEELNSTAKSTDTANPPLKVENGAARSPVRNPVDQISTPSNKMYPWALEQQSPHDNTAPDAKDRHGSNTTSYHDVPGGDHGTSNGCKPANQICLPPPPPTTPPTPYQHMSFPDPMDGMTQQSQLDLFDLLDSTRHHSPHAIHATIPGYQHDSIGSVHDSAISFGLFSHAVDRSSEHHDLSMLDNFTFPAADGLNLNGGYAKPGDPHMMPHPNQVAATPLAAGNFMAPLDFRLPADQHQQPLTMDLIDDSRSTLDHQNPPSLISTPRTLSSDAPLEERIDYVLASIKAVGFKDLNASVTAYYTGTFSDTSTLHAHQRMSRNRRLPRLIAAMRASAEDWSEWERRGFCEELLWGAEDIFRDECKAFGKSDMMQQLQTQLNQGTPNRDPHGAGAHCLQNAKRAFQEDLPNLWALITTLSADNNAVNQRDRMQIAFSIVFTLCCGNRMSKDHLVSFVQQSLGIGEETPT